jgi:ABC-type transport system substrate-binding protein
MRTTRALLVAALLALAAAGCSSAGTTAATSTASPSAAPGPGGVVGGGTSVVVTVVPGDGSAGSTWTLSCDPPSGDHPAPDQACEWLASARDLDPDPLDPVGGDVACTEIYGGAQTATVTGTLAGEPLDSAFSRTNGCEIARWDAALPLLVEPGGV